MKYLFLALSVLFLLSACKKNNPKRLIDNRDFKMGFSTWSYGPTLEAVNASYDFVSNNGDVYSEHMDHKIPWDSWINGSALPIEFTDLVEDKLNRKPISAQLFLSVSFLNNARNDIMEDFDGQKPDYDSLTDSVLIEAYVKHLSFLVDQLKPAYLVYSIESNELFINTPDLWAEFRVLMDSVSKKLRLKYPTLEMAESVTLHNWYQTDKGANYLQEVESIANQGDFAAISFYPFFSGLNTKNEFQSAFDFLHSKATKPIAIVETNHLAEDLIVDAYNLNIESDEKEQEVYLETLLLNAHNEQYKFIIWWAHRDFDALWETFPDEVKDLGRIWRDTGLQDEDGNDRKSMKLWRDIFAK